MKKLLSVLLSAVMMVSVMAVPAFADVVEEYGVSVTFGEPVGIGVKSKDKWGFPSYIKNNDYMNVSVYPLSEAPKMDYVKTIEGVTFSNYIRHVERNSKDYAGNPIKVYQVYVGLDASMRSNEGAVEFMTDPAKPFNNLNENVKGVRKAYSHTCSDLNMYKTNTACLVSAPLFDGKRGLTYLYDIGITPYTNGDRNMDGTWKAGLTWVFGRYENGEKSNGTYTAVYPIRVNQGDTVTYYQVAVTDGTNFSGERVTDFNPVVTKPSEPVTVAPAAPTYALKSFSDVSADRWSHDAIMDMVKMGLFSGTTSPNADGVGTFAPTATMTRAQFVTVVTKYLYGEELSAMKPGSVWYENNFELAREKGLFPKYFYNLAAMEVPIRRQEMAEILVNALAQKGVVIAEEYLVDTSAIADYDSIEEMYQDYVRKAFSMGMLSGVDSMGTFAPLNTLTREQGAMVLYRLVNAG